MDQSDLRTVSMGDHNFISFLDDVGESAMMEHYIYFNPFKNLRYGYRELRVHKYRRLSDEEVKKIMESENNDIRSIYLKVKLMTGLRTGEINGLTWEDVDPDKQVIYVRHQLAKEGNVLIESTKNYRSRTIHCPKLVFELLKQVPVEENKLNLVFMENGKPFNVHEMNMYLRKMIGNDQARLHDLRVTYASLLYEKSKDIDLVRRDLGHGDAGVTEKYYLDVDTDMKVIQGEYGEYYEKLDQLQ